GPAPSLLAAWRPRATHRRRACPPLVPMLLVAVASRGVESVGCWIAGAMVGDSREADRRVYADEHRAADRSPQIAG
ncbi:hypothetical protein, partial [Streptomyces sp.]|uniref:hypothetical protein n=1 Tax=Streptomyces sp. TaxID=1931 RepID=UPI002D777295